MRVNGSEGGPARLAWYTIEKDGGYAGDILAAFELFLVSRRLFIALLEHQSVALLVGVTLGHRFVIAFLEHQSPALLSEVTFRKPCFSC